MTSGSGEPPLRIAVIGAGWAGQRHIQAIREVGQQLEAASIYDSDTDFVRSVAADLEISVSGVDYREALDDPTIDAVAICTPHHLHRSMGVEAVAAGKHVLVEKPMALSLADGHEMVRAAEEAGVCLVVAENQVYDHLTVAMTRVVRESGALGSVAFGGVVAGYRAPDPRYDGRRAWLTSPELGGTGTWWLQGVHTVARCRTIFGDIETVYAVESRTPSFLRHDIEGTMSCLLTTTSGAPIWLVQSPEVDLGGLCEIRVYGDAGRATLANGALTVWGGAGVVQEERVVEGSLSSYGRQYLAFLAEIRDGQRAPTTGASELNTLAVVEAALRSASEGRPITVIR